MIYCTADTKATPVTVQGVGVYFILIWISLLYNVVKRASSLLSDENQGLFPLWLNGRGVKVPTHPHLVPLSKKVWSYTPLPIRLHGVMLS
jgi:hypothetical protein